jgi:outer membrane immunogenic protein
MKSLRHTLLATASSVALIGSASAADMPMKAPAPAVWSWAGPYVGLNVGAAWRNTAFTNPDRFSTIVADPIWTDHGASFIGGAQIGYNWQTANWVYGLEADFDGAGGKSSAALVAGITASSRMDWLSTVRGRAGMLVSPQLLAYLTGGVAFAQFSDNWGFPVFGGFSSNDVRAGWTAGGGLEYMISPRWTVRVEGLYADFGSKELTNTATFGTPYRSNFQHTVALARAALNWKW